MRNLLLMIISITFLVQARATQVSGTLTINAMQPASVTNFRNFSSLITYLTSASTRTDAGPANSSPFGVSGPLVVNVVAGTGPYAEKVTFLNVTGASATNTITINGNGNIIQYAPYSNVDCAIVRFNNADFYRLKRLTIKSTSVNFGWGIHIYAGSDNNIIDSCNIDLTTVTSTISDYSAGIVFSNSLASPIISGTNGYFNVFSNCNIIGNPTSGGGLYYGIVGVPATSSTTVSSNKFYNNTIQNFYSYGVYWQHGNGTTFEGNTIKRTSTKTGFTITYAFYLKNGGIQDTIRNNIITDLFAGYATTQFTCYGIYANNYSGASASQPNVVDNNLFNFNTGKGSHYGMYMLSAVNFALRNNTFAFHNNSGILDFESYAFYSNVGTSVGYGFDIRNNIFFNNRASTIGSFYTYYIKGSFNAGNTLGKNSYYGAASCYKLANINGLDYSNLSSYNSYMGSADLTSTDYNPNFVNAVSKNFAPQDGWFDGNGVAMPHMTKDVTGATRTSPIDIGAYEVAPASLDVAYSGLSLPVPPYAAGVQTVSATIRNAGSTTITSAIINWTVNGVSQTPVNYSGSILAGSTSSSITLGTFNAQPGTVYNIVYTISNPNGGSELITTNNTMGRSTASLLPGGIYTINRGAPASSTNFTSFTTLGDCINMGGIAGAVTFNVAPTSGPYNNQVFLRNVLGVSATNTITINGNGNRVDYGGNPALIGIINVIGTDYVTFNQLHVKSLHSSYGVGYLLTEGSDYVSILGCTIDISSVNGSLPLSAGIAVTSSLSSPNGIAANTGLFNRFIGNTILGNSGGPYFGISAMANDSDGTNNGYIIKDNIIRNFRAYGIVTRGVTGSLIENNEISRPTQVLPGLFVGIDCTYLSGDTIINNKITKPFEMSQISASSFFGISLNTTSAGRPILVAKNLIADVKSAGLVYGIRLISISESQVYHNTVSIDHETSTAASTLETYAYNIEGAVNYNRVKNNIFYINRGGTGSKYLMYLASPSTTGYDFRNNGLFYGTPVGSANNFLGYYSTNKIDLAAWRSAIPSNPLDSFSVFADPKFRTAFTQAPYTPGADSLNNKGADLRTIVPTDITGIAMDSFPDPGAYKFDVSPLPVKLTSLRAVKQNTNAVLSWITASERNASQFIVERSMDRRNFEAAGSVRATGNSSVSNSYQFTDANIVRIAMGKTVYYRLRIVDADGKFEYSPIVAVSFEDRTRPALNVYPNPFTANVSINVTADVDAKAIITIVDLYGKTVAEMAHEVVKGDNLIQVDTLQNLAPGVYFVKVNAGNSEMVTKLIKE